MSTQDKIVAYTDLLATAEKYPDVFENDDTIKSIKKTLQRLTISERFGIPLQDYGYHQHYQVVKGFDNWTCVSLYDGAMRQISWSDDGTQPEDEWLLCIGFPTGAYIFGEAYPEETFDAFFAELKGFGAKYSDTKNSCLYFTEDNAKAVYDAFWDIFRKYQGLVKEELQRKRKKELEAELAKLNKE